jgi:uncharacterized protein
MESSRMNPSNALTAVPKIGFGQVRHARLKPVQHAFNYATYFLMLPMRSLASGSATSLKRNRWAALSFYDKDHGDGRENSLAWLDELLATEGIDDATGEVWLHCYPRVFGYTFKPVSFWYCHGVDNSLRAIVVEVNNTFGERHCYLLDKPVFGIEQQANKVFHVSPFNHVEGNYRFRFMTNQHNTMARVDYDDDTGPLLQTSVSGVLETLSPQSVRKALWNYPAMTFGVIARIHWQAFKLWRKRVSFVAKPVPPELFITRS